MQLIFGFKNGSKVSSTLVFGDSSTSEQTISNLIKDIDELVNLAHCRGWSLDPEYFVARFISLRGNSLLSTLKVLSKKSPEAVLWDISENRVSSFLYKKQTDPAYKRRKVIVTSEDSNYIRALDVEDENKPKMFLRSRILAGKVFATA